MRPESRHAAPLDWLDDATLLPAIAPPRIPFVLMDEAGLALGSVAIRPLEALREWPEACALLTSADGAPLAFTLPAPARDAGFRGSPSPG